MTEWQDRQATRGARLETGKSLLFLVILVVAAVALPWPLPLVLLQFFSETDKPSSWTRATQILESNLSEFVTNYEYDCPSLDFFVSQALLTGMEVPRITYFTWLPKNWTQKKDDKLPKQHWETTKVRCSYCRENSLYEMKIDASSRKPPSAGNQREGLIVKSSQWILGNPSQDQWTLLPNTKD